MAALEQEDIGPETAVLDIGTGSGALAVRAAQLGGRVTAVDIAPQAVATARLNAMLHRRRITVRRSDLLSAVSTRRYDLVLCNPPYVPAPDAAPRGASRSWNAGSDGRAVIDRLCSGAPSVLRRGGVLLMVHSGLCDSRLHSGPAQGRRAGRRRPQPGARPFRPRAALPHPLAARARAGGYRRDERGVGGHPCRTPVIHSAASP